MKLALPIGLLGLLSLGILLLIYLLKPKFQQKEVSSTHIWKMSLKYRKQKIPFEWLNSIVLILQILAFILASLMIAQPFIPANAQSEKEQIIILESSASMLTTNGTTTRFDRAKNEIIALSSEVVKTHLVSIIIANNNVENYLIYRGSNENDIINLLNDVECSFGEPDVDGAFSLAYSVLERNPQAQIVFYSSKDYNYMSGVEVKNMSSNEWNVAILDFSTSKTNNYYFFSATVASYNKDDDVNVDLIVDGFVVETFVAKCRNDEEIIIKFETSVANFLSAKVRVEKDDSFTYDNNYLLFLPAENKFLVQYVSKSPNPFFEGFLIALQTNRNLSFQIVEDINDAVLTGYDLYIFEGVKPSELPTDGSVLFVDPPQSTDFLNLQFTSEVKGEFVLNSTLASPHSVVLNGVTPNKISVTKFRGLTSYEGFDVVLTANDQPALLIKNEGSTRVAVMTFSINYSNIVTSLQFPILMYNLFDYFLPSAINSLVYDAGVVIEIKSRPSVETIDLNFEQDSTVYSDFPLPYELKYVGEYKLIQTFSNNTTNTIKFFVKIPRSQSDFSKFGGYLPVNTNSTNIFDDIFGGTQLLIYLAMVLFALLLAEWWLQYREQ